MDMPFCHIPSISYCYKSVFICGPLTLDGTLQRSIEVICINKPPGNSVLEDQRAYVG